MKKYSDLYEYVESARKAVNAIQIEGYEKYFSQLDTFENNANLLNQILFVIDFRSNEFVYLSPNTLDVLGYQRNELVTKSPLSFMEMYHPDDALVITSKFFIEGHEFIKQIKNLELSKVKVSYNFRLRQKDNSYKVLHQQFLHLSMDEEFNPLVIMGTTADITEIQSKPEVFCRIHQQNQKGKWIKIYERIYSSTENADDYSLTPKEFEIIKFIYKGLSSKEIAALTQRSEETIRSQRKSILSKTNCQNMTEVIVLANKNGWL